MKRSTRQEIEKLGHKAGLLIRWDTPIAVFSSSEEYVAGKPVYTVDNMRDLKWLLIGAFVTKTNEDVVEWNEAEKTWKAISV